MIEIKCDRCRGEMDPQGLLGQISWRFKEGMDGDYGENELANHIFCERCMDEIMAMIQRHVNWGTQKKEYEAPVIEEVKKQRKRQSDIEGETAEKIITLYKQGKKVREIAKAVGLDDKKVENWLYYKKRHGGI